MLPETPHLSENEIGKWVYKLVWPNIAFDLYPDQIDFMQFIPLSANKTLLREISYGLPDERREMRAARYLNWRINRVVNREDKDIIERVQAGLAAGVAPGPISSAEIGLRDFAERVRRAAPICRDPAPPWSTGGASS